MINPDSFDKLVAEISQLSLEPELGHSMRKYFQFEDKWINLNQGSFGTYPKPVRTALQEFQVASERRPDEFIRIIYPILLDKSRAAMAAYLNVPVDEIVFVANATTGINTVLRSLKFSPGDKIVYFEFIYGACGRSVQYIEETTPAVGVKVEATFPISDDELVKRFRTTIEREQKSGANVRIAIFDTIVSMPGVRLPFERLVAVCKELGVMSLVDGAHGVGHIPLDLAKLGPDFFVSNCYKWLYVPRGCSVFHVPLRNQPLIRSTLPTSHGFIPLEGSEYENPLGPVTKSDFVTMFEFVGTVDNSPILCIPAALRFRQQVCGGEEKIMTYSHKIAKTGAELIAKRLGTELLERENGDCCLYNIRLPLVLGKGKARKGEVEVESEHSGKIKLYLMDAFQEDFNTAIPIIFYNDSWWARISGQIYLDITDFEFAADVLEKMCEKVAKKEYL